MNRQHASSVLVAALSSAFGVTLISVTAILAQVVRNDSATGSSELVELILATIAWAFIAIAIYTGAVVTANTFSTIIAGRARTIALLRLIGSSAAAQRRVIAREGLVVGVVGSLVGAVVGLLLTALLVSVGVANGLLPDLAYDFFSPSVTLPIVAVVLTTLAASWIGSRRVLTVSPMQATGAAQEASLDETGTRHGRNVTALVLFVVGGLVLGCAVLLGLVTPLALLVGVVGGLISFTGFIFGATAIMPRALRTIGRAFGSGATARLASENAVRYPQRSARTTIGLVIGVTLVTTFAVTVESFQSIIRAANEADPQTYQGTAEVLSTVVLVFSMLMGFSALIAAVGLVNNLSLNVLQRTRELGLLRALGFTARQVRSMILVESAQLTAAAVVVGFVLGTFYGWVGAQSLLGSISGSPGIVPPVVPLLLVGIIVVAAVALTAVASVAPARRATRIPPVAALAVD